MPKDRCGPFFGQRHREPNPASSQSAAVRQHHWAAVPERAGLRRPRTAGRLDPFCAVGLDAALVVGTVATT
jgi:hypothetical protein